MPVWHRSQTLPAITTPWWQFGIYSNSACTTLVSGPHSTNTSGKISVTGLTPGTYYVKELGHTDSAINALYYCSSTNPQAVTVTAGATATVSFANKLNTGNIKLIKATNTGANLSGWQIGLYTNADCTNAVSGSPFTTGADGTVTAAGLQKGTYYAKEIPTDDANWVNEYILQGSFDERLALDPMKYCIQMGYDALSLAKDYEDLHNNLYCVDVDYPTKKEILAYFEVVEKAQRGLRNAVNLRQTVIEAQLERIKYSLF